MKPNSQQLRYNFCNYFEKNIFYKTVNLVEFSYSLMCSSSLYTFKIIFRYKYINSESI